MAKITFFIPDQDPAKYDLSEEAEVSIGRAPDCDIILDHHSISGHHATIRKIGAGLHVLEDNNSTNGIYLEGAQVTEAPLANGASVTIGSVPTEYEGDEPGAGAATQEDQSPDDSEDSSASGYSMHIPELAESSHRPPGFKDMSPVSKIERKDNLSKVAMILGLVAILSAIALILLSAMMSVA